jgi:hypothetical protein
VVEPKVPTAVVAAVEQVSLETKMVKDTVGMACSLQSQEQQPITRAAVEQVLNQIRLPFLEDLGVVAAAAVRTLDHLLLNQMETLFAQPLVNQTPVVEVVEMDPSTNSKVLKTLTLHAISRVTHLLAQPHICRECREGLVL